MTIMFPGGLNVLSLKDSKVLLSVCHPGPWKGAAKIGKINVSPAETQRDRRVISGLMGSTCPLLQGLCPGLRVSEFTPQAFHSAE